jgi:hypothetical protein
LPCCYGNGPLDFFPVSRVEIENVFPMDIGFAMTIHRSQGRTMGKVILALSKHPNPKNMLTMNGFYVSLSRVRRADDIRFLLERPDDYTPLQYIEKLRGNDFSRAFFEGFDGPGSSYSAEKAYEYRLRQVSLTYGK